MRRLCIAAAALALAACQVDVEGAPCDAPGTAATCPGGQACGLDGTCTRHAHACLSRMCTPGALTCADGRVRACTTDADPVCGAYDRLVRDCAGEQLVCAASGDACACPDPGTAFHFDVAQGGTVEGVAPSGAATPAGCRLPTLAEALARAEAAGPGARAVASGAPATYAVTPPLVVPAGVTLTTDASDAADEVLAVASLEAGAPAVVLGDGAVLERFTVRNAGATTGSAVSFACAGGAAATLSSVHVEAASAAGERMGTGVLVGEACGATLDEVTVSGASGPGLLVDAGAAPAAPTTVVGGAFTDNGTGLELHSGTLEVRKGAAPTRIASNRGRGIYVTKRDVLPPVPTLGLLLTDAEITANAETGLRLENLPADATVALLRLEIHGNHASTAASAHSAGRKAGGVVLQGTAPASFSMRGTRVFANDDDQVGMYASTPWRLAGIDAQLQAGADLTSCPLAVPNVFACAGIDAYLIFSSSTTLVDASWNVWDPDPPDLKVVKASYAPSYSATCGDFSAIPVCPSPSP